MILLVDDQKFVLEISKAMLEKSGYGVMAFQTAKEALAYFICYPEKFSTIVADLQLDETVDDMDGIALIQSIQKHNPSIKAVLHTASPPVKMPADIILFRKPTDFNLLSDLKTLHVA